MPLPEFILERRDDVTRLCHRHLVRQLDLFGSATRSDFRPDGSDLDFLVELASDLPAGGYADAYFGLKFDLEALFGRPVDLLTMNQIVNPYLRARVEDERVMVFVA